MSTQLVANPIYKQIGGIISEYIWCWQSREIRVVYETLGDGAPLLLLPALSTVSMRSEMAGIAQILSSHFQTVTVDFPGFGDSSRFAVDYQAGLYEQFLADFITATFSVPIGVVAAGHSATYILKLANQQPELFSRLVFVAPTWRGPLPTMGVNREVAKLVKDVIRLPILGQLLYKLNTLPSFLKWMYSRHVYADSCKLTPDLLEHKWHNTQQPGARYAPGAFVTGTLDGVSSTEEFLLLGKNLSIPLMVVIGDSSPPKSRSQMDALAQLNQVESIILPGTLGMHEEYAVEVATSIAPFLKVSAR